MSNINSATQNTGLTEQQAHAAYSIDKNMLVSAGAGSGKTHVLVERYVEILKQNSDLGLNNLIAVTFTRKAAAEMKSRLKLKFKKLAETEKENGDLENALRWSKFLGEIDSARIGTIHSLCESILKTFASDAKLDPQFEIFDDVERADLILESIDRAFQMASEKQLPEAQLLVDLNFEEVRSLLQKAMLSGAEFRQALEKMQHKDRSALLQHLNGWRHYMQCQIMREVVAHINWTRAHLDLSQLTASVATLEEQRLSYLQTIDSIHQGLQSDDLHHDHKKSAEIWSLFRLFNDVNLKIGGNKDDAKAVKECLRTMRELVKLRIGDLPAEITEDSMPGLESIEWFVSLYSQARAHYEKEKDHLVKLDYDDLIGKTLSLLQSENSPAKEYFASTTHAILVDEFQDTNKIQSQFVGLLAGPNTRMFVIGDEKQSIYKFQGSDVSTFNEWKSFYSDPAKEAHELTRLSMSFRSHPNLVGFVNYVFERLLVSQADKDKASYLARFDALDPFRKPAVEEELSNINLVIVDTNCDYQDSPFPDKKYLEAAAVARWIQEKVNSKAPLLNAAGEVTRTLRYGDFAVLLSRNSDFTAIEWGLARYGIPFSTYAGTGFFKRQEILDLENLLRFLGNQKDSHSLLGILRSPLFGIADDIIHEIAQKPNCTKDLWQAVESACQSEDRQKYERLPRAVRMLRRMIQDSRHMPIGDLLASVIRQTGYDLILLASSKNSNGLQKSRNLWKLVSLAKDQEELSCIEFAERLALMREFSQRESDTPIGTTDSVKIMTIHASKGLEFPAICLPNFSTSVGKPKDRFLFGSHYGFALNTVRDDDEDKCPWWRYAQTIEGEMDAAERRRLLYVAMTRARDYLGIFLEQSNTTKVSFRVWMAEALGLDFTALPLNGTSVPEIRTLNGLNDSQINYQISGVNLEDLLVFEPQRQSVEEAFEKQNCDLSLMEEIPISLKEFNTQFRGELRITLAQEELVPDVITSGVFFHLLMEHLPCDPKDFAENTFAELASNHQLGLSVIHPTKRDRVIKESSELLKIFLESELYEHFKNAKKRFAEFPYMVSESDSIKNKRADCVFLGADDKWYVVDFKTDRFDLADLEKHRKQHEEQIRAYANDLGCVIGLPVIPILYFARLGKTEML
ncbi:MAG: UvrD-helicase domain-containing protein [Candidatus Melainabacteria bacterium]|nr:UvrD-helicase domain-containing protein [Candidatus Melainabacteria bacterium]